MSNESLKNQITGQQKTPTTFPAMLDAFKNQVAMALPKHMSADRVCRIALTEFRKNPKLAECDPKSVFAAVIIGSQLGLEPGIMGQAYLVPYKREAQLIPGWQGYVDLVSRAGRSSVWTGAVFKGDEFDYALGDSPFLKHKPSGEDDPNLMTHAYAIGRINGAQWPVIEVWPVARITKHRDKNNKVGSSHYSYKHWEMYCRKVVLLQVIKYMPKSIELNTAANMDYAADSGMQNIDLGDAINGTYERVPEATPEKSTESQSQFIEEALRNSKNIDEANEACDLIRTISDSAEKSRLSSIYDEVVEKLNA